jgi:hypothetical protein
VGQAVGIFASGVRPLPVSYSRSGLTLNPSGYRCSGYRCSGYR